ncbi:MAG: hypothetical protein ACYDGR_00260 [Candidatus Dormibacteria bacterium]
MTTVARRRRIDVSEFARTLLDEAIRLETHPGIVFRDTPVGREAAIGGRRLYVWQVVETVWANAGDIGDAGDFLGIEPAEVEAALAYCVDYSEEIDELIHLNQEEAERLESHLRLRKKTKRR